MNSKIDKDEHSLSDFLAGNRTHEHHGEETFSFMYEDECIRYGMKVKYYDNLSSKNRLVDRFFSPYIKI